MKAKYLNYSQAWAVCNEYQSLKGHSVNGSAPVEAVLLAPYSRILQWHYIRGLMQGTPPERLLESYPGDRYDVIVLIPDPTSGNGYAIQPLRDYLAAHDLPYHEARRSSGLRAAS